jgi:protein ImuB
VSIWFRHLKTDWHSLRQPDLISIPFVLCTPTHGRMIVTAANAAAMKHGIANNMVLADARAVLPGLNVQNDQPDLSRKLLKRLAEWSIRFTPIAAVDLPDGLMLDVTGCSHLWGGDHPYLNTMVEKLSKRGYDISVAMADTPGVAWAIARYGIESKDNKTVSIPVGKHIESLLPLPVEALRLEPDAIERLHKLGLHRIEQILSISRPSLRRRFGQQLLQRLDLVTGREEEVIQPVTTPEPYQERLPCMEPIVTSVGIEAALNQLLKTLCSRLREDQKGLRRAVFKGLRVDGNVEQIEIGTSKASHHVSHLFKLFELKIQMIDPGLGIELFMLEASKVEDHFPVQEKIWEASGGLEDERLSELIDRLYVKTGTQPIRYLPDEHYWPERSTKVASSLKEKSAIDWQTDRQRPLLLLSRPEKIEVTAPIPDYPPMLFHHKDKLHRIVKADGPERIEQEWWLQRGQHRDYYRVEDEEGKRYWLFRLGHYDEKVYQWYLHGFFS